MRFAPGLHNENERAKRYKKRECIARELFNLYTSKKKYQKLYIHFNQTLITLKIIFNISQLVFNY